MADFLKKALSVFVEIEEDPNTNVTAPSPKTRETSVKSDNSGYTLNQDDVEKFGKHFDDLLNDSNLPGPDYFEFCKMMEALESAVPDEKTRYAAVFATLSVQGLSKQKLLESAKVYVSIVEKDKQKFELAVNTKVKSEIDDKKLEIQELEKKIAQNSEAIKKLTQEITDAQNRIQTVNLLVKSQSEKIKNNLDGYNYSCNAVLNKMNTDINKIQSFI